jgi:16S rRNA (guanine966-N2)-methyltransferase
MRIVAGKFRSRSLASPKGQLTRPTTDRVRESLFNMVHSLGGLNEKRVLDLFAGTGALGLEALSRGASHVTFVEKNPKVLFYARQNAETFSVQNQCAFLTADVIAFLKRPSRITFDYIFADPPYEQEGMDQLPERVQQHLSESGIFILEHDKRIFFDEHPRLITSRKYGRTIVSIFGRGEQGAEEQGSEEQDSEEYGSEEHGE